ncbi:MAG: 4Fe-4S binding protein [Elusimicrobiota bacterium]
MSSCKIVNINTELCTGCGVCVDLCPKKILYLDKKTGKCAVTDETKCDKLGGCERNCQADAIKITRTEKKAGGL